MKKCDITSAEFLNRLAVVYGDDAPAQQERYSALAERFENEFNEIENIRFFSAPGSTAGSSRKRAIKRKLIYRL